MSKTALAFALFLCTAARAERAQIDFERAKVQPFPIAVARTTTGPAAEQVAAVVSADFDRSGLFKLLDPRSFLADPAKEGMTDKTIDFAPWLAVGAQGLLKIAGAGQPDGSVRIEFHLFDAPRAAGQFHGDYSARPDALRTLAHRIADDIVHFYTGEPGDFSTRIAYVRQSEKGKFIVVADSDGANAQAVTGAGINLLPGFAPDGKSVAFTSFRDGRGAHIYSVELATGAVKPLVVTGDFAGGAAFAPDGARFAFSSSRDDNTDIYLSEPGGADKRLTDDRGIDISASFSPDGKQLAFVSDRGGNPQIYVMNADGSRQKRLTFEGRYNQEPAWSPKGDVIAFCGRDERGIYDIFTIDVASGKVVRLTDSVKHGSSNRPTWSPNGRHLIFNSTRNGGKQIWMMTADGENLRQITNEKGGATDPSWGPLQK